MEDKIYEEKYQKGFNAGYMIAKFAPELSSRIIQTERSAAYLEGFVDAHQIYQLEKDDIARFPVDEKDFPAYLQSDDIKLTQEFNEASKNKEEDKGKDKDLDIEPDI